MGARASTGPEFELARDEILALKESLVGFSRNPLGKTVNLLLASLLTLLIKSLSKRKD